MRQEHEDAAVPGDPALVLRILASHRALTGRELLPATPGDSAVDLPRRLYVAPVVVLAHDASSDPCFTYANQAAQRLFGRSWDEMVGLPSRFSAEAPSREERARLLERVAQCGFIDDYSGIRVAKSGQRFRILRATVWNVDDEAGRRIGQAAAFSEWEPAA